MLIKVCMGMVLSPLEFTCDRTLQIINENPSEALVGHQHPLRWHSSRRRGWEAVMRFFSSSCSSRSLVVGDRDEELLEKWRQAVSVFSPVAFSWFLSFGWSFLVGQTKLETKDPRSKG